MGPLWQSNIRLKQGLFRFEVHSRVRRSGYEHLVLQTTLELMQQGFITTVNHEPDHFLIGARQCDESLLSDTDYPVTIPRDPVGYIVFEPASHRVWHTSFSAERYRPIVRLACTRSSF